MTLIPKIQHVFTVLFSHCCITLVLTIKLPRKLSYDNIEKNGGGGSKEICLCTHRHTHCHHLHACQCKTSCTYQENKEEKLGNMVIVTICIINNVPIQQSLGLSMYQYHIQCKSGVRLQCLGSHKLDGLRDTRQYTWAYNMPSHMYQTNIVICTCVGLVCQNRSYYPLIYAQPT